MRLNEQEPAAVVLERLGLSKPQPSSDPKRPDLSYPERLKAWEAAVERETKRDQEEKAKGPEPVRVTAVGGSGQEAQGEENVDFTPEVADPVVPEPEPPILTAQAHAKSKAPRKSRGRRSRPPRKMKPRSPRRR